MSAKHIVLGLLAERPAYPYQLLDRLKERSGPDWRINSGQFYQLINRVTEEGLIERVDGSSAGRDDDRHVFALTDPGLAEFEHWRRKHSAQRTRPLRRPVLAKLLFAGPENRAETLDEIDSYERACRDSLTKLAKEVEGIPTYGERIRADRVILQLALDLEIDHYEAELAWCPTARERFEWLYKQDAIWPSSSGRRAPEQANAGRDSQDARKELFGRIAKRSEPRPTLKQSKEQS